MLLLAALLAGAPSALPAIGWMTEESGILELQLAHLEPDRVDGGLLRVDGLRRLVRWEGLPGNLGCQERLEAGFEDVKSIGLSRAGFALELRDGRRLTFLPLPHAAWLSSRTGSLPDDVSFDLRRAVEAVRGALGRTPPPSALLQEALHGTPVAITVAELIETPTAFVGRALRARGRVVRARGRGPGADELQLVEEGGTITVSATPEIAPVVAAAARSWEGREIEVTGVFRRDPVIGRPPFSIVFWDFTPPDGVAAPAQGPRNTTLAALAAHPIAAELIRVAGRFRGRNLYGDLPPRRMGTDWVIKDGPQAAWVTGKGPRGEGWSLDLDSGADTHQWVEVVARPEVKDGILRLHAQRVTLVAAPPGRPAVRPGTHAKLKHPIAPVVIFALPVEGDAVSPNGRLIVQFNKYMDEDTFSGRVRMRYADSGEELTAVKLTYDDTRRALVIDPGDRLQGGRRLECVLLSGIADVDGLPLTPRSGHETPEGAVEVLRYDVGL